ncbi:MAG: GNAT family N-acetyltransferase [Desulfobacterales bacterium]|jgi:CelD/BcsL family acetyltransferase involved in cellulose biosynthesis|nr:GNAT family N-acetyltransferase [Desulfobacterales bacterium]
MEYNQDHDIQHFFYGFDLKMKTVSVLSEESYTQWDVFVERHPMGSIYHLSGWKKALEESFKHIRGELVVIWNEAEDGIVAGLPVYHVDSRITGKRLVSAPFANFCEPLIADSEAGGILCDYLIRRYQRNNSGCIEVKARARSAPLVDAKFGIATERNWHHFLPLDASPELLIKKFHKKSVRVPISKAQKNGLQLRIGTSENDLSLFYEIYANSRKRIGLPSLPYRFFEMLWGVFRPSDRIQLIMCMHQDAAIGASLLLKFKDWVFIEYGHDVFEFRRMNVNHFLDWEAIKLAHNEGFKYLSFGRTSDHNTGLMAYKSHWATSAETFVTHFYPEAFSAVEGEKETSWKYHLARKICKSAPPGLYRILSATIYRHLK